MSKKESNTNAQRLLIGSILIACTLYLGYFVQQDDFWQFLPVFVVFFGLYSWIITRPTLDLKGRKLQFWIGLAILLRFVLLFGIPNLSDDVYRFIWDGRLIQNGINPFTQLPTYYIEQTTPPAGINLALFQQLNSPNYYTIYPPVAQFTFFVATWLFPESIWGSAFVMKLFLFAFECGNIFLLLRLLPLFGVAQRKTLIYALNPLIIVEISENLHFEGAMIFFLLLSLFLLLKSKTALVPQHSISSDNDGRTLHSIRPDISTHSFRLLSTSSLNRYFLLSALAFALAIASKLLPVLFLPLFIKRLGWKKSILYFAIIGLTTLGLFTPLISGVFLQNFGESLDLYFRKFEFNASFYYVARWLGFQLKGFNLIAKLGPALAMMTFVSVLALSFTSTNKSMKRLPVLMLFAISIYLSFTTTVHPWYVSLPLVLCCFSTFRYPVLWSGLILLTYINYSYSIYQENLWIVGVEYVLVWLYFLWESLTKGKLIKNGK